MSLPCKSQSLWIQSGPKIKYQEFKDKKEFDVVIVGAGITGITTGYILQNSGLKTAIIDKDNVSLGVTGHTTGKITSAHGIKYTHLLSKFGEKEAKKYADANQYALEWIERIVKENDIKCDFEKKDAFTYGLDKDDLNTIKKEVESAKKLDLPASFVDKLNLPFKTVGAAKFSNQAQFHVRKYLLELASIITNKGGVIFDKTKVIDIKENNDTCTTVTEKGELYSNYTVLANHFPFLDNGFYFAKMYPRRSYLLASKINKKETFPDGMFYSTEEIQHTFRTHTFDSGEKFFIVGGENHKTGHENNTLSRYEKIEEFAKKNFKIQSPDYRWSTQDNVTIDGVPYIGKLSSKFDRVFVGTGYGGWGITNGTVAGLIISDLILGKENPWQSIFSPKREKSLDSTKNFITQNFQVAKHFITDRFIESNEEEIKKLKKGEAKIFKSNNKKIGIYKNKLGKIHAVNVTCTHLGCILNWNNAEKSWDCPCHGSRFNYSGRLIHGPAVRDLPKEDIDI